MTERDRRTPESDFVGTAFDITSDTDTDLLTVAKAKFTSQKKYRINVWFTKLKIKATEAIEATVKLYTNGGSDLLASMAVHNMADDLDAEGTADHYKGLRSFSIELDPDNLTTDVDVVLTTDGTSVVAQGHAFITQE